MNASNFLLALPSLLLLTFQLPGLGQLRDSYREQENTREIHASQLQNAVNLICKYGQFIAPAFGASNARHVYLIDKNNNIYRYTDDSISSVLYSDKDYGNSTLSTALTCKPSTGFIVSLPYARLGRLGTQVNCESNYLCEYSVEALGLYVYKKQRNSAAITRIFLANRRNALEIGSSGTYRRCDGYFASSTELRICFGK